MAEEIVIISNAEDGISRFLSSFISDSFHIVCCNGVGEELEKRISVARTFGALNNHYCVILPVETGKCGRYDHWYNVELEANPCMGIIVVNYDSNFLEKIMGQEDIKQFVLDNMDEVKSHIGLEHLKERIGNDNIKYI